MKMKKERNILPTRNNHLGGGTLSKKDQPDGLTKFKKNSKQKKMIIGSIVGLIVLVGGITLYRTFALYEEKKEFNVLRGKVPEFTSGDITIAAIIDGEASSIIPGKEDGYVFESITCNNGAEAEWNSDTWKITIGNLSKSKTTCTVSFKTKETNPSKGSAIDYIVNLSSSSEEIVNDGTEDNNIRYIGSNPNNYVLFNNELWRIIGVMNNIEDSNGNKGSYVKIIRNESIGSYSWDNKNTNGINSWPNSSLRAVISYGPYTKRTSGRCPSGQNGATTVCNFSETGLTSEALDMLIRVNWPYGRRVGSNGTASSFYTSESQSTTQEIVGLMSPSDYGYAVGGSVRATCLNTYLSNYNSNCVNNNWLYIKSLAQWTIVAVSEESDTAFYVSTSGTIGSNWYVFNRMAVRPVVFLKPEIIIESGTGTSLDPFILGT